MPIKLVEFPTTYRSKHSIASQAGGTFPVGAPAGYNKKRSNPPSGISQSAPGRASILPRMPLLVTQRHDSWPIYVLKAKPQEAVSHDHASGTSLSYQSFSSASPIIITEQPSENSPPDIDSAPHLQKWRNAFEARQKAAADINNDGASTEPSDDECTFDIEL